MIPFPSTVMAVLFSLEPGMTVGSHEFSCNVVALDILRVLARKNEAANAVLDGLCGCLRSVGERRGFGNQGIVCVYRRGSQARVIAEKLARLGALAALIEANGTLAEAYTATRLNGSPHAAYRASDLKSVHSLLLSRVLPPSVG